jgi:long-chain fatty acid transport protein
MKGKVAALIKVVSFSSIAIMATQAYAAGYRSESQSVSTLASSGDAAVIEDASTNWYNSAGLNYLPQQLVLSSIVIYAPTKFSGTVVAPQLDGGAYMATGKASSHPSHFIPAMHYARPINERLAFGISVVPAWGLSNDYGEQSIARYSLVNVKSRSIDIAPSLAYKLNDHFSIGAGPDVNYFSVNSKAHVRTQGASGTANDSYINYEAHDWAYGGHIGLLYRVDDDTRFGINYRSKLVMHLRGDSEFQLDNLQNFANNDLKLLLPLPPVTTLSAFHRLNSQWAMLATIAYDQWNVIKTYRVENLQQPSGTANVILPQYMRNTFDVGMGAHYQYSENVLLRGSFKYQMTPVVNQNRGLQFPDGNKLGINVGSRMQLNKKLALDLLYSHVFVNETTVNDQNPLSHAQAIGKARSSIDLVGAQLVWNF